MSALTFNPQVDDADARRHRAPDRGDDLRELLRRLWHEARCSAASSRIADEAQSRRHRPQPRHVAALLPRSEADAIGSVIELRGSLSGAEQSRRNSRSPSRLLTVVGVLPSVYEPTARRVTSTRRLSRPGGRPPGVGLRGAVATGVSLAAAEEEANVIGNAVRAPRPATEPPLTKPRFASSSFHDEIVEPVRPALRVFLVAVAVVLLIVCAPTSPTCCWRAAPRPLTRAGRAAGRRRQPRAIVRQIFTECLVLSAVGGVAAARRWAPPACSSSSSWPPSMPRVSSASVSAATCCRASMKSASTAASLMIAVRAVDRLPASSSACCRRCSCRA